MSRKAGMIHAMSSNAHLFKKLSADIMPDVEVVHLVDEGLPSMSAKSLHQSVVRRLARLATSAKESGAEIVMLTCTAFGRLAEEVQKLAGIPVIAVLEIVADEAMGVGDQIGILATHPGALATASEIIREQAALKGKKVQLKEVLCEGGLEALKAEDWPTHDRIVSKCLKDLMGSVKVVVIPQPSIERVVDNLPESSRKVPVLSSGRLSVRILKEKLDKIATVR